MNSGTDRDEQLVDDVQAQAWTYAQTTGELQRDDKLVATGYSGNGPGKNNPAMEDVPNVGPIPSGDWTIAGPARRHSSARAVRSSSQAGNGNRNRRSQRFPDSRGIKRESRLRL